MELYFSEYYGIDVATLERYGAFDISVVTDMPLFVDPFLLFNSEKSEYQDLHDKIIDYLVFLKEKAAGSLDPGLIRNWYRFKEVKQNWLGFTLLGNGGHALGDKFAHALHGSLGTILTNFGEEQITAGSHLEKLCLIRNGVGRDCISDFTTNLIKEYLLEYTQTFARSHLKPEHCREFSVTRARFNYKTETWETRKYYLPMLHDDFVILTPTDMLTRDETWISQSDMIRKFDYLPAAVPNDQLRAQINNYFRSILPKRADAKQKAEAAQKTILKFPELIDRYIRIKEDDGEGAQAVSQKKVDDTRAVLVEQVKRALVDLQSRTDFYERSWTSYEESLARVHVFKHYVENCDGYRVINRAGKPFSQESEVQIFFGILWCGSDFDANREVNNGRGPVDFKVSYGAKDKSLIEFKLGSNSSLKRNLENQVKIYEAANGVRKSVKVIVCYTKSHVLRVKKILKELDLVNEESVVVIDARSDNKPSASKV
ncbi:hypothetical protein ACFQV2_06040 [Actinokineospora soli]|uniref:Coiled-coil protein n=1 Tax=Actinokineospora soli TaxID=1048753 RepID=A0ABW2TIK1_9PSEU